MGLLCTLPFTSIMAELRRGALNSARFFVLVRTFSMRGRGVGFVQAFCLKIRRKEVNWKTRQLREDVLKKTNFK